MNLSSEEDSEEDNGERMKNVRSLLVKTPDRKSQLNGNCVFKRKLGDLIFDANFEAGNLGLVQQVDKFTYDLMVRPDVANPRIRIWFNFKVSNQKPGQCVIFSFVNLSEDLALFYWGLTPVVRSRMFPNWIRIAPDQVFYYNSADHNNRRILSIAFRFSSATTATATNEHQFALFYPYTMTNLIHFVNRWTIELKRNQLEEAKNKTIVDAKLAQKRSVSVLAGSLHNRSHRSLAEPRSKSSLASLEALTKETQNNGAQLVVSTLVDSILSKPIYKLEIRQNSLEIGQKNRTKVFVLGGWSGNIESATCYVLQGLMDFMLSDHLIAQLARKHLDLTVVPMPDPDSVWTGNGCSDIFGQVNLTRQIIDANPRLYRNLSSIIECIQELCALSAGNTIILELQVNHKLIGSRIVGTNYVDTFRMERHLHFPRLLSMFIDGFYLEKCKFIERDKQSGRNHLFDFNSSRDNIERYCLQISPYAYHRRSLMEANFVVYQQETYLLLGKSIAYTLLELVRTTNNLHLPKKAIKLLDSFQPGPKDVDDLILREHTSK